MTRIYEIQGSGLYSPMADQEVEVEGVVTGKVRRGYFLQDPSPSGVKGCSDGIFVFSPKFLPTVGSWVTVKGKVVDYEQEGSLRPVTQIKAYATHQKAPEGPRIEPIILGREIAYMTAEAQAEWLNQYEGMMMAIAPGATFLAPSNPFGDYVVLPAFPEAADSADADKDTDTNADAESKLLFTREGGLMIDLEQPHRWYPNFRIRDYDDAPSVNVGATLTSWVAGPLNYRVGSFQISALGSIDVDNQSVAVEADPGFDPEGSIRVMTVNGFNLDVKVEREGLVDNPRRDIDDDVSDQRFINIARDIVQKGFSPDIVALQEIQDNDGAEITDVVDASETYQRIIDRIRDQGGADYEWADIPPKLNADGGQPGGNIRNGFLYRPDTVTFRPETLQRLGEQAAAFEDSRKPIEAHFVSKATGHELAVFNLHLASKRHQISIFAHTQPGFDPRESIRVEQAQIIVNRLRELDDAGVDYYVTGDFNDLENSTTLATLVGDHRSNLVYTLPPESRYDYNHRGKLQVLMHGVVPTTMLEEKRVEYRILHGNELIGVRPGTLGTKPTDHAYVMAALRPK